MPGRERIEAAFRAIREELGIRRGFPEPVLAAAERAARRGESEWGGPRRDLRHLPFVTIDPPGSRDLDQALFIERREEGYRVWYAIADVGAFLEVGSIVEEEAWRRGLTYYSPDHREPLYPPLLSQGAASLLPDGDRPSVVFSIDLDERGALLSARTERAVVRSRAQLTYAQALQWIEEEGGGSGEFAPSLSLLREVGELRRERERERGGMSLPIRDQHVQERSALWLGYELVYEEPNAAEDWNAQISLLAGHAAALRMLKGGRGLLRTMAPPREEDVEKFRLAARALGFAWREGASYAEFIHGLDPAHPHIEPLVWQARRLMRGADYVGFAGEPPGHARHSALAMPYAHCTAPLRRLADRYVLELLVAMEDGSAEPTGGMARLMELPKVMDEAERRANRLERRVVDIAEAWVLRGRVGESFPAVVLDVRPDRVEAQLPEPPIRARIAVKDGAPRLSLGERVRVRVESVAPAEGRVEFALA